MARISLPRSPKGPPRRGAGIPVKELTLSLRLWISSHTPLVYDSHAVPEVVRVPQVEFVQMLYPGDVPQGVDVDRIAVAGLYKLPEGKVYLLDDVDLATLEGRAVLLHDPCITCNIATDSTSPPRACAASSSRPTRPSATTWNSTARKPS